MIFWGHSGPSSRSFPSPQVQVVLVVENPPASAGDIRDMGSIPGLEREGMATHSSILAWRILWTEEPIGLQSMGSQRVGHRWHSTHALRLLDWQECAFPFSFWACQVIRDRSSTEKRVSYKASDERREKNYIQKSKGQKDWYHKDLIVWLISGNYLFPPCNRNSSFCVSKSRKLSWMK